VDSAARHHRKRQSHDERSSAPGQGCGFCPTSSSSNDSFVERLGVSDHENAPSGLKKLVDSINLERNRMIEQRIPGSG
jgi:hypothetical protein